MRLLSRSLLPASCLALALLAAVADAGEAKERLRAIAKEAEAVLQTMSQQLRELQYRSVMNDTAAPGGGRVFSSGQYTVIDLQRSAQRLADLGSEANARASQCDKSVRDVARDFQSQARRVNSTASRLVASREKSASTLVLDQIDFAMQRAYRILPSLGSITECSTASDEAGAEEQADEDQKKKKNEKGTEDYDE